MEKSEPSCTACGNVRVQLLCKTRRWFLKWLKIDLPPHLTATLGATHPGEMKTYAHTNVNVSNHSTMIHSSQESGDIPVSITMRVYIEDGTSLSMEAASAIRKNEGLTHTTIWANREHIALSDRSHTQNATHCMIQLMIYYISYYIMYKLYI